MKKLFLLLSLSVAIVSCSSSNYERAENLEKSKAKLIESNSAFDAYEFVNGKDTLYIIRGYESIAVVRK